MSITNMDSLFPQLELILEMEIAKFKEFLIDHYSLKKTKLKLSFDDFKEAADQYLSFVPAPEESEEVEESIPIEEKTLPSGTAVLGLKLSQHEKEMENIFLKHADRIGRVSLEQVASIVTEFES